MINREKKIILNPLEDLEEDEKLMILTDIINSDPVTNSININNQRWSEVHSIFGGQRTEKINNYHTKRFRINIEAQVKNAKMIE